MLINSHNRISIIAELDLPFLDIVAAGTVQPSARVVIDLPFLDIEAAAGGQIPGACGFDLPFLDIEAAGRVGGEPNVFGACDLDLNLIDFDLSPTLAQSGICVLDLTIIDFEIDGSVREREVSELDFICDILPARSAAPGNYAEYAEKLTVDGAEIKVREWSYDENADRAGASLNITLLNPSDRNLLSDYSSIKFETGERVGGVWQWETLVDSGELQTSSLNFGRTGSAPSDTFTFSANGDLNARLGKTPADDLIIYDSSKMTLDPDDFEPILDTEGREYKTQLVAKSNLKLFDLFQKIFVERCGFTRVFTNLPNYPVSRIDFETGMSFYDSLKGLTGMFEPIFLETGGELKIIDSTTALPAGFPAPRSVTISKARALSAEQSRKRLDAFDVVYVEDDLNFDFITYRTKNYTVPGGTFGTSSRTSTDVEERYREYRKFSQPAVVVSSKLEYKQKTTLNHENIVINEATDNYFYDSFGETVRRTRRVAARVPDLQNDNVLTLLTVREETETFERASHPFEKRKRFTKRRTLEIAGLVSIDTENQQLGEDFERELPVAFRSGNLIPEMSTRFGALSTLIESFEPRRDGTVKTHVWEKDHLADLVIRDEEVEAVGEIGTSALASSQNIIRVFDADNAARSTEKIEKFFVGSLPLTHAVPLARRVLKKRKTKPKRLSMELAGRDTTIKKGACVTAVERGGNILGTFLVEGRFFRGSREGRFMTITGRQI